jgi:tRNA pseudouridine55 synthase
VSTPLRLPRRLLDGVLLLDKPAGLSSHAALLRAKFLLHAQKAGHTGTLDPLATGLLPVCFGEATKFSQDLLEAHKTYEAIVRLGTRTTTGDAEGEVIATHPVDFDLAMLEPVLHEFCGVIEQVPPMYSALKRDGKPLYEYARAGETVERSARQVTIYSLELLACELPNVPEFQIRVRCSKGTYIRTLAEDIGARLGCGAHLSALRRTRIDTLSLDDAVSLATLEQIEPDAREQRLLPMDALLSTYPKIELDTELSRRFVQGQRLRLPQTLLPAALIRNATEGEVQEELAQRCRVYTHDARLLGTARLRDGVLAPERVVAGVEYK